MVACPPEDVERLGSKGLRQIGTVGGDKLLGIPLPELREAWG